jgi:ComF family protein
VKILSSLKSLIYPPLCPVCREGLERDEVFCSLCQEQLKVLPSSDRCPRCFSGHYSRRTRACSSCLCRPPLLTKQAATFAHEGPAANLVRRLKYCNRPDLASGMGAFMLLQWYTLGWPLPDAIVPVPMSRSRRFLRGYNQSLLLSQSLGKLLGVTVWDALKREGGEFAQAGQSREQRLKLDRSYIVLRAGRDSMSDKTLLLVDDVMTTGTTLRICAEALLEAFPRALYGITFSVA